MRRIVPLLLLFGWLAPGQERDFLTTNEVEQVRLMQEPNERLKLYAGFAELRIELLRQYFAEEKPGRSTFIHDTLDDYTRIIETIDIVAEDALRRSAAIDEGIAVTAETELAMLAALQAFEESDHPDISLYSFSLKNAIDATEDSLELAEEDLGERYEEIARRDAEEKKELEQLMVPAAAAERREAEERRAEIEKKQKRKVPTLRRPGEEKSPSAVK